MGENQDNLNSLETPPSINIDLGELKGNQEISNATLQEIKDNQKTIIEQQKKLIDYFVPSEEELKKQKQEQQKKLQEEQKLQEELELEQEELEKQEQLEKEAQDIYQQEILHNLTTLNENITKVEFSNQNTNAYLYILCFGFLFAFVITFIYKSIKKFI